MAKHLFISFAIEDKTSRDFLVGQARHEDGPFEFVDMAVKEPWDDSWKTRCRTRIRGCDGLIAPLSKNTAKAEGAPWGMKRAVEEKVPTLCVHIFKDNKAPKPSVLAGTPDFEWGWHGIAAFIDSL